MSRLFSLYIPDGGGERLNAYVYRGMDKSLLYKYLWRPLCVWLVDHLPVWLAANVITVLALVLICSTHTLIAVYMPDLTVTRTDAMYSYHVDKGRSGFGSVEIARPPSYIFLLAAVALFLYSLLDNLDGYQARRTRTSSPLGLIMDHGCDAVNCVVSSLSIAAAVSAGPTWKTWTLVLSFVTTFFMNTWEEYYLGELVLPIINGANEGVMLGIVVHLITAAFGGPQWWSVSGITIPHTWIPSVLMQSPPVAAVTVESAVLHTVCPAAGGPAVLTKFLFGLNCSDTYMAGPPLPTFDTNGTGWYVGHSVLQNTVLRLYDRDNFSQIRLRYNTFVVIFIVFGSSITCLGNIARVYRAVYGGSAHGAVAPQLPFVHALTRLLPLIVLTIFATLWFCTSPDNIFQRHPRLFCWTVGLMYTKSSIHLMIAHMCNIPFRPLLRTMMPFLFLGAHMLLTCYRNVRRWSRESGDLGESARLLSSAGVWDDMLDEEQTLWMFFIVGALSFAHLVVSVVWEVSAALGVPIFTVPQAKQEALLKELDEKKKHKKL